MNDFSFLNPETVEEALSLRTKYGDEAMFVSGGTNVLYMMKRDVRRPKYLINIKSVKGLNAIRWNKEEGLHIGALVKLSKLQRDQTVLRQFPIISQSVERIASPQIRSAATIGGNLSQEVWCWYLMEGFPCWMNGGKHCFAPEGDNRFHHTVAGGFICMAIHPSDLAPALYAMSATLTVAGPGYERKLKIPELLPGYTKVEGKLKQNSLRSNELITSVEVPTPTEGTKAVFLKSAARESFDFALASASIVVTLNGEICEAASIVLGGVATMPYKATKVESKILGRKVTPEIIEDASSSIFDREAPLSGNAYRIQLAKELVKRGLREACDIKGEDELLP
jgi:xanthine dehydrogenase YagS FAD-binding subunit